MSKRKALGKGLRSLIPEAPPRAKPTPSTAPSSTEPQTAARDGSGIRELDLDRIHPNPRQPRRNFDAVALEELADSLRSQGLLQPVVVRTIRHSSGGVSCDS